MPGTYRDIMGYTKYKYENMREIYGCPKKKID